MCGKVILCSRKKTKHNRIRIQQIILADNSLKDVSMNENQTADRQVLASGALKTNPCNFCLTPRHTSILKGYISHRTK